MNILFLTTHLNTGGITSYLLTLTKGLLARGHRVVIVSGGGETVETFTQLGAECLTYNIRTKFELHPKLFFALPGLTRLVKTKAIDIVHTNTRVTQVLGEWLSRKTGIPHVSTCHGFFTPRFSRKIFPAWGKVAIAISPQVRDHLMHDLRVPYQNVVLVPSGIAVEDFPPLSLPEKLQRRKEKGIVGEPVIGIIARLSDVKGHSVLIDAMPKVVAKFPQIQLLIVGEGKMETLLRAQVERLGLTKNISFYPVVNRTIEFLALLDVFVMPSLQEGLGFSVMEAQAAGLPVVASKVGGIPTLIQDEITGLLVLPNKPQDLADSILFVLQNPQKAQVIGENARLFIQRKFSADMMVNKTIDVYTRAKSDGKNPSL